MHCATTHYANRNINIVFIDIFVHIIYLYFVFKEYHTDDNICKKIRHEDFID